MVIGILGAVGLVIGINQLQNKSNPSEVIPRPRECKTKPETEPNSKTQSKKPKRVWDKAEDKTEERVWDKAEDHVP